MAATFEEKQLNFIAGIYQKNILTVCNTVNISGDNTIITAPGANLSICITSIIAQLESAVTTTVLLKEGSTIKKRLLLVAQGDGLVMNFSPGFQLKLTANTALIINLSGANIVNYSIDYYVE